jgi:hypothetical protein
VGHTLDIVAYLFNQFINKKGKKNITVQTDLTGDISPPFCFEINVCSRHERYCHLRENKWNGTGRDGTGQD